MYTLCHAGFNVTTPQVIIEFVTERGKMSVRVEIVISRVSFAHDSVFFIKNNMLFEDGRRA